MKYTTTLALVAGLVACSPAPTASTPPPVASSPPAPVERTEHLQYAFPPAECTKMGGPVKHRSGQMGYERYNCEESCKVEIKRPPPCHDKNYKTVDELNANENKIVAVGGVVFQGNGLQPCASKSKECCESCSHYMALVDFKDKEKWSDCRRIFFKNDDPVMMTLVSMSGGCCILDGLMEQVIVTGKIEIKDDWWTFTEVQSICSLSSQSQETSP